MSLIWRDRLFLENNIVLVNGFFSQRSLAQKKGLGFKFFGCCHSLKRSVNKNDSSLIILLLIKTNINYTHLYNNIITLNLKQY